MIIIQFVRGLEVRDMVPQLGVNKEQALQILLSGHRAGFGWKIDYQRAQELEAHLWMVADLTARILRALMRGLPVTFDGCTWRGLDQAGSIEDAVVESGAMVTIESDDESGLVIVKAGDIH